MGETIMMRPEKVGSMWANQEFTVVHGPRFVAPHRLIGDSYFIRGIRGDIVKTKLAKLRGSQKLVIQSRMRIVRPWEIPLIKRIDVFSWLIKPVRIIDSELFTVYTFYFKLEEAVGAADMLRKRRGAHTRINEGKRHGIRYWVVLRSDKKQKHLK
jgi:hypothetical protein